MKEVILKIITIVLVTVLLSLCSFNTIEAAGTPADVFSGANNFVSEGESQVSNAIEQDKLADTSNFIYNILLGIAMVIAVAIGATLGIKFMVSSVEEQAKIKEVLVPYVAGCIVVFGALGIWKLAVTIFSGF